MNSSGRGRRPAGVSAALVVTALVAATALLAGLGAPVPATASGMADPDSWTVYHGDGAGHGVSGATASVDTTGPAWSSPALVGALFGEPLVTAGRVYVATEDDRIYALSTGNGAVVWTTRVGIPVPATSLPCGDIQPTVGITGTPVIDEGRDEIFVVADELVQGTPTHVLVGLSATTGQVEMTDKVDPPGSIPSALLQRTGLALDAGQVVFGFGGNYGDCSSYRGWVVAVGESGGTPRDFAVDAGPGEEKGAIWMGGGAPAIDGQGNIWVSAGNGSVTSPRHTYDNSDSVLELSPTLRLLQFFAPSDWAADNAADRDLSMEPVLLADGQVMIAGKSQTAFLLDAAHLGGIGGQRAELTSICPDDVSGGGAVIGSVVYLPCTTGVVSVRASLSPPSISRVWSSGAGGGPPIVAGGSVWSIARNGELYGLDPATGAVRQQSAIGPPDNHFATPSVGDGLLLVPSGHRVVAFTASAPGTPSPSSRVPATGTTSPVRDRPAGAAAGGLPPGAIAGLAGAGAVAIGAAAWLLWRRRGAVSRHRE